MKDLGMKDQVALKFSAISLRSATVILSQLEYLAGVTFMTSKKIWWYAVCAKEYREAGSLPLYASQGNHEYVDGKKESGK